MKLHVDKNTLFKHFLHGKVMSPLELEQFKNRRHKRELMRTLLGDRVCIDRKKITQASDNKTFDRDMNNR